MENRLYSKVILLSLGLYFICFSAQANRPREGIRAVESHSIVTEFNMSIFSNDEGIADFYIEDDGAPVTYELNLFDSSEEAEFWYDSTFIYAAKKIKARRRSCRPPRNGKASWYGPGFHGKSVACQRSQLPKGKKHLHRFNQNAFTAAHKTLKCGSRIRVRYRGRSVIVMITDAGPYSGERVIDLSSAAAKAIGLNRRGVAPVKLSIVSCK